jgi:anti-anti-sigma factor
MDDFTVKYTTPANKPATKAVTIGGAMTIRHVPEIKAVLLKAMAACGTLLVDLQGVTAIDPVGFQVICAAHRLAMAEGKQFSIIKSGNQTIETAMQSTGFFRHTGCVEDTEQSCAWIGGRQECTR